jgi:hypothetical protein
MSGDEKAQQIGQVVTAYQTAKVELAHLEQKLKKVGQVYTEVGQALEKGYQAEYKIENGHFRLSYSRSGNENISGILLNEETLVALLMEREAARKKTYELHTQLKNLGITNLE